MDFKFQMIDGSMQHYYWLSSEENDTLSYSYFGFASNGYLISIDRAVSVTVSVSVRWVFNLALYICMK